RQRRGPECGFIGAGGVGKQGTQWTGIYNASGNLTCRTPSSATTCIGTATGAQLSYDHDGQLTAWQNAPASPRSTGSRKPVVSLSEDAFHHIDRIVLRDHRKLAVLDDEQASRVGGAESR